MAAVEELDALLRLTYQSAAGKRAPWKPLRIPRPEPEGARAVRREPTVEEMLRLFGGSVGGSNGGG